MTGKVAPGDHPPRLLFTLDAKLTRLLHPPARSWWQAAHPKTLLCTYDVGRKIVMGVGTMYLLCLLCSLGASRSDITANLSKISSRIGGNFHLNINESYSTNCDATWNNVRRLVFEDHFFITHVAGYVLWGIGFRSYAMTHALSILFELVELALRGWIPNFQECWFDSVLLDVAISNTLGAFIGIEFGAKVLKLECTQRSQDTIECIFLVVASLLGMLNGFLLKAVLIIPPDHWLFLWRAIFVGIFLIYMHDEILEGTTTTASRRKPSVKFPAVLLLYSILITVEFLHLYLHHEDLFPLNGIPMWSRLFMLTLLTTMYASIASVVMNFHRVYQDSFDIKR